MKRICLFVVLMLVMLGVSQSFGQVQRDTLNYADSSRITTTWGKVFIGPNGVLKSVNIKVDTSSSTQTVLFLVGAASDTNNPAKKNVLRLSYSTGFNGFQTTKDSLWLKTLGGSVPVSVTAFPIYPATR